MEQIRDRSSKMLDLNDQIRRYDFNNIREEELEHLNDDILRLNLSWKTLQTSLDEKLRFCEEIHRKHQDEVQGFIEHQDDLDKDKFQQKVNRVVFEMKTESQDIQKAPEEILKMI